MSTAVTTGPVRLSFEAILQPRAPRGSDGPPKYSATLLVPKTDTATVQSIFDAIEAAKREGIAGKWKGVAPAQPPHPVHDGDGVRPSGEPFGEECRGMWVFTANASAERPPQVVDQQLREVIQPTKVYSGMWVRVNVNFFAYNSNGRKGIGAGLNCVQLYKDDEPLSFKVDAKSVFSPVAAQPQQPQQYPQPQPQQYPQQYPQPQQDYDEMPF